MIICIYPLLEKIRKEKIENIKKILDKHKIKIEKYKIHGSGIGFKTKNGKVTNEVAILFYVNKKKDEDDLKKENIDIIPKEIEGISTDVVEVPDGFKLRNLKI